MDPVIAEWLAAARQRLGLRAVFWLLALSTYGFALGWALRHGAALETLDLLVFIGACLIGAAAFHMSAAAGRSERKRRKRLDALYGRRSAP